MPYIDKMFVAESNISSDRDELKLLISESSIRKLAPAIIDGLYSKQSTFFNSIIHSSPYLGEYDFGIVKRVFAEYSVASIKLNKGRPRYNINKVYRFKAVDLYLSGEWYAISRAKPTVQPKWPSINDLIRVLNTCFGASFVYIKSDKRHELWGPTGTL